jgi:hypothetical protein
MTPAPTPHPPATTITLAAQLAQLPQLPMAELWALWDECFERRPGHHQRTYLESRLAYQLQARACGGLAPALRRRLEKIGETGVVPNQRRRAAYALVPGTTLLRDYNGLTHRVTVLPDGRFEFAGQPYQSLSAIARAITGCQWSGPAFFGLKPPATARRGARP